MVEETQFHPPVGEVSKSSVVSVKEVTKKKSQSIVAPLNMNYGREQILSDYGYPVNKVKHNF